jgi:Iap family predicted aminopeptidase
MANGIRVTLARLSELLEEPETDDYGIARPRMDAYEASVALLEAASNLIQASVPPGSASTDAEGGVRITWRVGDRELRLVVHAEAKRYLYHECGDDYGIESARSPEDLAKSLEWLSGRRT